MGTKVIISRNGADTVATDIALGTCAARPYKSGRARYRDRGAIDPGAGLLMNLVSLVTF